MSRILVFGALLGLALFVLFGLAGPTSAQRTPSVRSSPAPSEVKSASKEELELEVVDSEQAIWNIRTLNDTIYQDGSSVNSVMFERRAARHLRRSDFLPPGKVEEVEVRGPMAPPTVVRIQGRQVRLPGSPNP